MHPVKFGRNTRMSFSKINEPMDVPNLIEVQKKSYDWFFDKGLKEIFREMTSITDFTGKLVLEFVDYRVEKKPKYTIDECRERDTTYSAPLKVKVNLINKEIGEIKEQEIFMGDFPLMTEHGTFVINGIERVVVSQLVRSPGIYYGFEIDKSGKKLFSSTVIPNRGAWLEYEMDANSVLYVRIDRTRKVPVTSLIRGLGIVSDEDIKDVFGECEEISATLNKDITQNSDEGIIEIYKKLRPGEPPSLESARSLFNALFFDSKRYDLARVGRYKFNKKLNIVGRIVGRVLATDVVSPVTGKLLARKGDLISREIAEDINKNDVNSVKLLIDDEIVNVFSNNMGYISNYCDFDTTGIGIESKVYVPALKKILEELGPETSAEQIRENLYYRQDEIVPRHILIDDIMASINYILNLQRGLGQIDDIDHLGNRRLKSVGELLQNQFRLGISRVERVIKERMTIQDLDAVSPQTLINVRPIASAIREFFGSSQLSQFMDQTNPLSELTHKRRLSALGPGGLSRERAGYEVRDVHYSHYGRMCPIETPEGPNIGLITSLSTYARVNEYGFIETPYRLVDKVKGIVTNEIVYMTADEEDQYIIAQANEELDEKGSFKNSHVIARHLDKIFEVDVEKVDYMDVSPKQIVSVATAMIPFLENDDASRAQMGAGMQRQAVPLLKPESPIIGTGMEYRAAIDSGAVIVSQEDGLVEKVAATHIVIKDSDSGNRHTYKLLKFMRSNHGTCINQQALVKEGKIIKKGTIIADGPSTENGEIALGKNVLIGFMTWEGYNYEDAILISEKLVKDDTFTSIHIEEHEIEARDTKLGPEEITRDIPNVGEDALKDLDDEGIIRIGAEVRPGDILVGKITPKGETDLTSEERLLRAIFGEKAREVRDTSLRVPHGESGIVIDVKIFLKANNDELPPGVNKMIRCYIAQKRKISVGDKMAGRHGNKGVISRILPEEDMPFLPDGTPLEIVLNPLGVPSRMNIGQVLEVHLGYAAKALGWKIATPVFDGAKEEDIIKTLEQAGLAKDGKTVLFDGRTGEPFDNRVTVGYMYILKLAHLVDDKIHARSTGPYSLVTQQPLGGKAQFGGQRFGEMEVWALYAYGASYTLQELLTVKSDDVVGRVKTYESIVKGQNVPKPGVPESFKVLIKELQSLSLDIKLLSGDTEISADTVVEIAGEEKTKLDDEIDSNILLKSIIDSEVKKNPEETMIDDIFEEESNDSLDDEGDFDDKDIDDHVISDPLSDSDNDSLSKNIGHMTKDIGDIDKDIEDEIREDEIREDDKILDSSLNVESSDKFVDEHEF